VDHVTNQAPNLYGELLAVEEKAMKGGGREKRKGVVEGMKNNGVNELLKMYKDSFGYLAAPAKVVTGYGGEGRGGGEGGGKKQETATNTCFSFPHFLALEIEGAAEPTLTASETAAAAAVAAVGMEVGLEEDSETVVAQHHEGM